MSQVISFIDYTPAPRFDDVAWTHVIVEEAATSVGTWTQIDSITLSPVDADPANPAARNVTTSNASDTPDLWYRLTFADDVGGLGQPSTPIQDGPAATQFATSDDLASRLGITFTADEGDRANTLLTLASGLIQQETNQTIAEVIDDELSIRSAYGDRIRLPQRPVQSVASVVLTDPNGTPTTVDTADYYLDLDELVRVRSRLLFPELSFGMWARGWLGPRWTMTVTYTHGYAVIPDLVKATCMEMVIRAWVNPGSVAREQVGDTMTVYDNMRFSPSGLLLTDTEKDTLNDLLGRRQGTVTLR